MNRRITTIMAVAAALVVAAALPAGADHAWGDSDGDGIGYHWPGTDPRTPGVVNAITATGWPSVEDAVNEWEGLSAPIDPFVAPSGPIEVRAKNGSAQWLGIAEIRISGGHITAGRVTLNNLYRNSLTLNEWDHVLCQEIGHVLGLDHSHDTNSCMNDQILSAPQPNTHDNQQLNIIYAHGDGGGGGGGDGGGGGGPDCNKNPQAGPCRNQQGQWIVVHTFAR